MAKISPERLAALEREQSANASGSGNFWTMKGLNKAIIRLCPIPVEEQIGTKSVTFFINNRSYIDNEAIHGKSSVFQRAIRALGKLGTEEAEKCAELLRKQRRTSFMMKICVMNESGEVEKGPLWYRAPKQIYLDIYKVMKDDGDDLLHPREGCNIRISKEGEGLNTDYSIRVLPPSPLAETKERRQEITAAAADLDISEILKADEAGGLAALQATIPKNLWSKIAADVRQGIASGSDGDDDANPAGDEDDAPPPKKPAAAAADDDEAPAPKPKKPAAATSEDEEELPPPKPKKPAAPADDEDAPPPKKPAAPAATDDEDAPPPKPKKPAAPADDEDAPPPKPKKPAPVDDEDAPPAPKKPAAPAADEDDPPPPPKKPARRYTEE